MSDRVVVAGAALLALYLGQAAAGLEWPALVRLQANDTYAVLSGLALAGYLWHQLTSRSERHRLAGALAPVVLYLHASRFAYGYLLLLALVYAATALVGLVHRATLRRRWLYTTWFIAHVATSTILVVLGAYHVAIALAYE